MKKLLLCSLVLLSMNTYATPESDLEMIKNAVAGMENCQSQMESKGVMSSICREHMIPEAGAELLNMVRVFLAPNSGIPEELVDQAVSYVPRISKLSLFLISLK